MDSDATDTGDRPTTEPTQGRFVVTSLDKHDEKAVYQWAYSACKLTPLAALAESVGGDPTVESVLHHLALTFPEETRDAALRGCQAGFARRGLTPQR